MARREWLAAWVSLGLALAGARAAWAQTLCNGHGSFSHGVCTCATGYAGVSCNQCASNYVGYPSCGSICGDVNDNGAVDASDVTLFRAHLASPTGSPFSANGTAKCTVAPLVPTLPPCDILDVVVIRRSIQSPPLLPPRGPDCPFVSPWNNGDEITFTQASWGHQTTPSAAEVLLENNFNSVYATVEDLFQVGIPGTAGFSMIFTSADTLIAYLPAAGTPGPLDTDLIDPMSSASGPYGGDVAALKINVDFSDFGVTKGNVGVAFGDLLICGLTTLPALNSTSVRDFLGLTQTLLGGGTGIYAISDIDSPPDFLIIEVNGSFAGGVPSTFAQAHLFSGACP